MRKKVVGQKEYFTDHIWNAFDTFRSAARQSKFPFQAIQNQEHEGGCKCFECACRVVLCALSLEMHLVNTFISDFKKEAGVTPDVMEAIQSLNAVMMETQEKHMHDEACMYMLRKMVNRMQSEALQWEADAPIRQQERDEAKAAHDQLAAEIDALLEDDDD